MEFDYLEVKSAEHLEELKMMGFVCVNGLLIEVPDNVIVLAKLTFRANDPEYEKILSSFGNSMDISALGFTQTTRIVAIMNKKKKYTQEQQDILNDIAKVYPNDIDLKKEITTHC